MVHGTPARNFTGGHRYPEGYLGPASLEAQMASLLETFPQIPYQDRIFDYGPRRGKFDGYFLVPRFELFGSTYVEAVASIMLILDSIYPTFSNQLEGQLGFLDRKTKTKESYTQIYKSQHNADILMIPAQFGRTYKGRVSKAIYNQLEEGEFPLDSFSIAVILAANPEILDAYRGTPIFCEGDEFKRGRERTCIPFFEYIDNNVEYMAGLPTGREKKICIPTGYVL